MLDLRRLQPIQLRRLLNTRAGEEVLTEKRLRLDRDEAGYRIGDDKTVDFLKYLAWLVVEELDARNSQKPTGYEAIKAAARDRASEAVRLAQDIGELPEVADPERRAKAEESFKFFCEAYFRDVFYLEWSPIHLNVIEKIERVVRNGEIFALAMPRGSGKTTLTQLAALWAAITGKTEFVAMIAASSDRAQTLLEDVKTWLETNDALCGDFPEVCVPIRKLERIAHRQKGQRYRGEPTRIEWGAKGIVFPTIPGSKASGVAFQCSGMSGAEIRGLAYVRSDGQKIRPTLAFVDDPQTRESAQSKTQCDDREKIVKADVLGMAGPGKKCACLVTCTVVAHNDLAVRLLDRTRNPDFRGEKYRLLEAFPTAVELWDEYKHIRDAELLNDGDGSAATEFYRARRAEMDAGAIPTWPERYNDDEISAVQFAMNLKFRDENAFSSEYQNDPILEEDGENMLSAADIANLATGRGRGIVPDASVWTTGFIDVHKDLLYWCVCAWESNFSGVVVDYGTYPDQKRPVFALSEARPRLCDVCREAGMEASIFAGLRETTDLLFAGFQREDGSIARIDRCLIDANWGQTSDLVYKFCNQSVYAASITPSHGMFVGASSRPFGEYKPQKGDRIGPRWRIPAAARRGFRHVVYDTNYWKTFVHSRLATKEGDPGALSLFGKPRDHFLFASHLTSEYRVTNEANMRRVDEWKLRVAKPDNHWFDCLVGNAVAASMCGALLPSLAVAATRAGKRVSYAEIKKRKGL